MAEISKFLAVGWDSCSISRVSHIGLREWGTVTLDGRNNATSKEEACLFRGVIQGYNSGR